MIRFAKLLALFLVQSLLITNTFAAEKLVISVGEWAPYLDSKKPDQGHMAYAIRTALKKAGYEVEFPFQDWKEVMPALDQGRAQLSGLWLKNDAREVKYQYSLPILQENHSFFYNRAAKFSWNDVKDLKGKRMVVLEGFSYGPKVDYAIKEGLVNIKKVSKDKEAFMLLLENPELIYPQEKNVGLSALSEEFSPKESSKIGFTKNVFHSEKSYLICLRSDSKCLSLISKVNEAMRSYFRSTDGKKLLKELGQ